MEQKPDECPEPCDDSVTPIPEVETMVCSDSEAPPREACSRNPDFSSANVRRSHKESLWNESCIPGKPPALSLSSVMILLVLGIVIVSMLSMLLSDKSAHPATSQTNPELTDSESTQKARAGSDNENPEIRDNDNDSLDDLSFTSEAGLDQREQRRAEACRYKTEQRLAQINEIMIWRLDDWRQPLSTFQDMIVQLSGVGTGGGTWVGHAMCRNDFELETELLESHAEALAARRSEGTSSKAVDPKEKRKRAADWQAVWTRYESMAEALRISVEVDEIWKSHLAQTLDEARYAHQTLTGLLDRLEDAEAAWAVIDYCDQYLSTTTQTFLPTETDDPAK
jgi:hypothetical protein